MKIAFDFTSRAALGKILGEVLAVSRTSGLTAPEKIRLNSRHHREDLAFEEVLETARQTASDVCSVTTPRGDFAIRWLYGPRRSTPGMWGHLQISRKDVTELAAALKRLAVVGAAVYGNCDLEKIRFDRVGKQEVFGPPDAVIALRALYWFNYFGPEYRQHLPVSADVRDLATSIEELENGGLVVITRKSPDEAVDEERLERLAHAWPVFRAYTAKAGFSDPVRIDYTEVWGLPGPEGLEPQPVRTIVGPPDEFIASVPTHAERFHDWLRSKGLSAPENEEDFLRLFQEHEAVIRDELLVPAIAAYGELVRARMSGVWKKAELLNRGEPVVARPGRPWTARRVIAEVLDGLEPIEV